MSQEFLSLYLFLYLLYLFLYLLLTSHVPHNYRYRLLLSATMS